MKNIILYTLIATLSFPLVLKAEEIALPVVKKPAALEEGTQRELSASQIAELLPWAKDSKVFLLDMLDNIQGLPTTEKIERLIEGIKSVVGESAPKNSELLMRYALNRGLAINDVLTKEMSQDVVGTTDAQVRVLIMSAKMAIAYYDTDMSTLTKKTAAPFVVFGVDYFNFLNELNKSIFDASAQYNVQRIALEWLQWDLYRDLNNTQYAPQIVKITNNLKLLPTKKLSDSQSIAYIRQMKNMNQQLDLRMKNAPSKEKVEVQEESGSQQVILNAKLIRKNVAAIRITNGSYYHVVVKEVYADGNVDVEYTDAAYRGQRGVVKGSELSFPLEKYDSFTVNTNAVRKSGQERYHVIIKEIYVDGSANVEYTDAAYRGQRGVVQISSLSYSVERLGNFTINSKAIRKSGDTYYHVTVLEIFADGFVLVEYTDAAYRGQRGVIDPSQLSLAIE